MHSGPHIKINGLTFGFDTGYGIDTTKPKTRFFKGRPIENLLALGGSDTEVERSGTSYPYYSVNITSYVQSRWSSSNNTLTISYEGKRNFAGGGTGGGNDGYPVFYVYFTDWSWAQTLGITSYNWSRRTKTFTMPNPSGKSIYFSIYHMNSGNRGRSYSRKHMLSFSGIPVPFKNGVRSNTDSLIDLSKRTTLDTSTLSFATNGQPIFDGTDDYLSTNQTASQLGVYNGSYTMESVFKLHTTAGDNMVFGTNQTSVSQGLHLGVRNGVVYQGHYGVDRSAGSVAANTWYHAVWVHTGSQSIMYINGQPINSLASHGAFLGTTDIWVGRHWGYFDGEIAVAKIYNYNFSSKEVRQHYRAYKNRFDL